MGFWSKSRKRIKEIRKQGNSDEYNIKADTPIELEENGTTSIEITYTSKGKPEARETLLIAIDYPCETEITIALLGRTERNKVKIWLPDTTAKVGVKDFCIPLRAETEEKAIEGLGFKAEIRFDASAFIPEGALASRIEGTDRILEIEGQGISISTESKKIGSFCGQVLLANQDRTPLRIAKIEWTGANIETETKDGSLTIEGLCQLSLSRLTLMTPLELVIKPNPVEEKIEILIRGIKGQEYTLEIINTLGITTELLPIKLEAEELIIIKRLNSSPSGIYLIRIGTQAKMFLKL